MPSIKKSGLIDLKLVRQKNICGARFETETVTRTLREILIRDEIDKAFRRHGAALAEIEDLFPAAASRRR
jgi:hypothetical protein